MKFTHNRSVSRITTTDIFPFFMFVFALCLTSYFLLFAPVHVELSCARSTCVVRSLALGQAKGAFGMVKGIIGSISRESVVSFPSEELRKATVNSVRRNKTTRYRVELRLKPVQQQEPEQLEAQSGGETEEGDVKPEKRHVYFYEFASSSSAEAISQKINDQINLQRHSAHLSDDEEESKEFDRSKMILHVQHDGSSWNQLFLALALAALSFIFLMSSHLEIITINRDCGVLVVERQTMYLSMLGLIDRTIHIAAPTHVHLLLPIDSIAEVTSFTRVVTENRREVTKYGVSLRLRDGKTHTLRLGILLQDRHDNLKDVNQLNAALRTDPSLGRDGDALESMGRTNLNQRGQQDGGGDPGGSCVVCWERSSKIAFAPCAHVCCCEVCGQLPQLTTCPVCTRPIQQRIGLYFS